MNRSLLLIPALALSATLVACDRNDDRTVGQRVDDATATAERRTDQVQADASRAANEARETTANMGDRAANAVSDATITAEVKAALAADPQLSALRIDVDTEGGVVTLTGPAPDEASRSRATQIAASPKGVTRVENQLSMQ